jgi:hypothetical protein
MSDAADPLPWPPLDPPPPGWLGDAPPEADAVLHRLTPAARLATAHALFETTRSALRAGVRMREPHLDDGAVRARVLELLGSGRA